MSGDTDTLDTVFDKVEDELSAMSNLSEEDAILQGMEDLDQAEQEEADEPSQEAETDEEKEAEPVYDKKELLKIFDTVLFEGDYREQVKIGRKFSVTLRTRSVGESNEITRKVDALGLKTFLAVQNYTNVITLAYAIHDINNVSLADKKFEEKYKKVKSLPEGLIVLLSGKLFDFDRKVMAAMEEGQGNF